MKQCKALFVKEIRTNWVNLLTPVWFTAGVYLITLFGLLISLLKGQNLRMLVQMQNIPGEMANLFLYSGVYAINLMLGTVTIIAAITLADNLINGGYKRKCEILHLSQPVSLVKILGVKYALMIAGTLLIFAIISLINSVLVSQVQTFFSSGTLYFGLVAWLQSVLEMSLSLTFLSSLFWFFAGLYKRKSFFMGVLTILAIQAAISILNWTADLNIPSLLNYLGNLASVRFETHGNLPARSMESVFTIINGKWAHILSWQSLHKLIYSAIFFAGGFWLYRRRELS